MKLRGSNCRKVFDLVTYSNMLYYGTLYLYADNLTKQEEELKIFHSICARQLVGRWNHRYIEPISYISKYIFVRFQLNILDNRPYNGWW